MSAQIRIVHGSSPEAQDVYRLRYEVYVEELGRTQKHADHERRLISEPLDEHALLLVAYDHERLIGSVRVNYARDGELGEYESLYGMCDLKNAHPSATSITTKMLVAHDHRHTTLAYRLSVAAYRRALHDGILSDFIDVYPARRAFFERMGYRVVRPQVFHSEFGEVAVMRVDTRDESHLRKVGSPFLRYLLAANEDPSCLASANKLEDKVA